MAPHVSTEDPPLTPEQARFHYLEQKLTLQQIADRYNLGTTTVCLRLDQAWTRRRPPGRRPDRMPANPMLAIIIGQWASGTSISQIARMTGYTRQNIQSFCQRSLTRARLPNLIPEDQAVARMWLAADDHRKMVLGDAG